MKYPAIFFFAICIYVVPVFATNYVVDPWSIKGWFQPGSFLKVNTPGEGGNDDRIRVPYHIRAAEDIDVLYVGSSRVRNLFPGEGLHKKSQVEEFHGQKNVFTAAFSGLNIHVARRVVEHTLALHDPEEAYLLLDFVAMNDQRPNTSNWKDTRYLGNRLSESAIAVYANFLDFRMFKSSLRTIKSNLPDQSPETDSGERTVFTPKQVALTPRREAWVHNLREYFRYDLYGCFQLGDTSIGELESTLASLQQKNVKTTLMTPPIHATLLELIKRSGNWEQFAQYLRTLTRLASSHNARVYMFTGLTPALMDDSFAYDYRLDDDFYDNMAYFDPGHFNIQIGRQMLDYMVGGGELPDELAGFAVELTHENIESVIASETQKLDQMKDSHPELFAIVPEFVAGDHSECKPVWARG